LSQKILLSLTEKLIYPEERSRLMKMVAVIHLRLFSTIQESREAAKKIKNEPVLSSPI